MHWQRQAGQGRERRPHFGAKGERHQGRAGGHQRQAKLLGDAVAKIGSANFGNRQAAGGDHQRARLHRAARGVDLVAHATLRAVAVAHRRHRVALPAHHAAFVALSQQHGDQVFCRAIAKQLAFVLLVKGDAVAFDQSHKILRRVPRQCRAAKARVIAQKIGGGGAGVGEIATPAAGDADFLGHFVAVVDEQNAQSALARHRGAKQTGGTGADDDSIKRFHVPIVARFLCRRRGRDLGLEPQGVQTLAMRPGATLGSYDKLGQGASTSATPMSGGCPMLPTRVPLHRAKNKFNNVNRYKCRSNAHGCNSSDGNQCFCHIKSLKIVKQKMFNKKNIIYLTMRAF